MVKRADDAPDQITLAQCSYGWTVWHDGGESEWATEKYVRADLALAQPDRDLAAKVEALAAECDAERKAFVRTDYRHTAAVLYTVVARLRALLPQPLVIEPGKWYRTRDGSRAFVAFSERDDEWNGLALFTTDGEGESWEHCRWTVRGEYDIGYQPDTSPLDIIAPWEDRT